MSAVIAPDIWASWKAELAGKPRSLPRGVAAQGFYEVRTREGRQALAIWADEDGDLIARIGSGDDLLADEAFCEKHFSRAKAVPHGTYERVIAGKGWPDEVAKPEPRQAPPVVEGAATSDGQPRPNTTPAMHAILADEIAEMKRDAEKWLASIGGAVVDQGQADKAAAYKAAFADLEKKADAAKKVAKAPVLKEAADLEAAWKPVITAGSGAKSWAAALSDAFLKAERDRKLAEATAKAAEGKAVRPEDLKVKAGTGRGVSLGTVTKLVVSDFGVLWDHYASNDKFRLNNVVLDVLRRLAEAELRLGTDVPGAHLDQTSKAR